MVGKIREKLCADRNKCNVCIVEKGIFIEREEKSQVELDDDDDDDDDDMVAWLGFWTFSFSISRQPRFGRRFCLAFFFSLTTFSILADCVDLLYYNGWIYILEGS